MQSTVNKMVTTCSASRCVIKYPFEINVIPSIPLIHSLYSDSGSD